MSPTLTAPGAGLAELPPRMTGAFEVSFAPQPAAVGRMRRITTDFLTLWNVRASLADDIVLLVSELVTNAVQHGEGDIDLYLRHADETIRIEVTDDNPTAPVPRPAAPYDTSGRGLFLVTILAHRWGTADDGRTTWCTVRTPTPLL
ncbi:hypothetical protein SRB5_59630 [Streptomyces sp. RB5]|uniref:Histidine kinase/HSP90-like ATPase domain-containing protein n=1 Tax=Streptomyces smaragdinus TaxID=2585196 RepID=A0A7K0CS04_9ACTN|nr:ATP-binding protein [Streptomyces smaragdinus]MQY15772.1 hypothetical protein [Streptomyces smaragdinus]